MYEFSIYFNLKVACDIWSSVKILKKSYIFNLLFGAFKYFLNSLNDYKQNLTDKLRSSVFLLKILLWHQKQSNRHLQVKKIANSLNFASTDISNSDKTFIQATLLICKHRYWHNWSIFETTWMHCKFFIFYCKSARVST